MTHKILGRYKERAFYYFLLTFLDKERTKVFVSLPLYTHRVLLCAGLPEPFIILYNISKIKRIAMFLMLEIYLILHNFPGDSSI